MILAAVLANNRGQPLQTQKFLVLRYRGIYSVVMTTTELQSSEYGARRLGVTPARFYELCRQKVLPLGVVVRLGRRIRVDPDALERFIAGGGQGLRGGWKRTAV